MRSMCVGVAETGVNSFLFLSFSFFSDKRKEPYKKSFFIFLRVRPLVSPTKLMGRRWKLTHARSVSIGIAETEEGGENPLK